MDPVTISPACTCNVMWTVDDFTARNGATIVVPGSHLCGREPDPELDEDANWTPAMAPAGSFVVLDGRVWHSTGANVSDRPRIRIDDQLLFVAVPPAGEFGRWGCLQRFSKTPPMSCWI